MEVGKAHVTDVACAVDTVQGAAVVFILAVVTVEGGVKACWAIVSVAVLVELELAGVWEGGLEVDEIGVCLNNKEGKEEGEERFHRSRYYILFLDLEGFY